MFQEDQERIDLLLEHDSHLLLEKHVLLCFNLLFEVEEVVSDFRPFSTHLLDLKINVVLPVRLVFSVHCLTVEPIVDELFGVIEVTIVACQETIQQGVEGLIWII